MIILIADFTTALRSTQSSEPEVDRAGDRDRYSKSMADLKEQSKTMTPEPPGVSPRNEGASYPVTIEEMSEKWRSIRTGVPAEEHRSFIERHFLAVGIALGLLLISLVTIIGGFVFLVWNAH